MTSLTNWNLAPLLPWWLWSLATGVVVASMVLSWVPALRTHGQAISAGSILRRLITADIPAIILLLLLLNPSLKSLEDTESSVAPKPQLPHLAVLLDTSASMSVADERSGQTRYQLARADALMLHSSLAELARVTLHTFDNALLALPPSDLPTQPKGSVTRLDAALQHLLHQNNSAPPDAIILLSDGRVQAPSASTPASPLSDYLPLLMSATQTAIPIHVRTYGQPAMFRDLSLQITSPISTVPAGQRVRHQLFLHQHNLPHQKITLQHRINGRMVSTHHFKTSAEPVMPLLIETPATTPGQYFEDWLIQPLPGEASTLNNQVTTLLQVIDQPQRVLVVEGQPSLENHSLLRCLRLLPHLQVSSWLQLAPGRWLHRAWGGSDSEEQWVIVNTHDAKVALHHALEADWQSLWIGHNSEALISSTASLAMHEHARSLIFYRGLPPANSDPTWSQLLASTGFLQRINMDHVTNLPGLLRKPLGWGEVVVIEPGVDYPHQSGTRTTDQLWLDLLQREPLPIPMGSNLQLVLSDDRIIFTPDELIQADLLWNPQAKVALPTHLRLQSLDATQSSLKPVVIASHEPELGVARVNLEPLPPGRYRIGFPEKPDSPDNDLLIEVREFDSEWLDVRSQPQTLIALAQVTGGKFLTRHNLAKLNDTSLQHTLLPTSASLSILIPVWDQWWVLILVFMLMAWGWWIRPREGGQ